MDKEASACAPAVLTIKERLVIRFKRAKAVVGQNWRIEMAKADPFFDSREGVNYMRSVAQEVSQVGRCNVNRLERVTLAMEKLAGIKSEPAC